MRCKTSLPAVATLVALGLATAACDQDEQGRVLMFKPGEYLGEPDAQLSEDQRETLRQRAKQQAGS